MNISPNIDSKRIQNPLEINQKWSNIDADMLQNRGLEGARAALGVYQGTLGVFWDILGVFQGILAASWDVLGVSWAASWGVLGRLRGIFWLTFILKGS